jgi:predicted dehydrogenase
MSDSAKLSRRELLRSTAAAGATGAAVPYFVPAGALGQGEGPGANDKLAIGLIGCGGMGRGNLRNCARHDDVVVAGVCDVWKPRLDATLEKYKETAKGYTDYRELLDRDDIDGVIIGTPPHWHALQSIQAAEAKKDFYVQKPMTIYVDESLAIERAAAKHGVVTQVGTQIHAGNNYRRVVEWVRSGRLGQIGVVRSLLTGTQGIEGIGDPPNTEPPKEIDWEMWVGPAPMREFNPLIVRGAHTNCSFMDYSGGYTPGMAPHIIDLPFWALQLDFPPKTLCTGGRYVTKDAGDAYDTQDVLWEWPDFTMTWMLSLVNSYGYDFQGGSNRIGRRLGVYFHGLDATLYANYGMHKVVPEGDRMESTEPPEQTIPPSPGHEREWLDCMKTRKQPSCNVSYHCKLDVAIGLANISYKLGREVKFDPKTRRVVGDKEAAAAARPEYRDPWKFPAEYLDA